MKKPQSKLLKIFLGKKKLNLLVFFSVIATGTIAALLEGVSFGFLLTAFSGIQEGPSDQLMFLKRLFFPRAVGMNLFFLSTIAAIFFQFLRSVMSYISVAISIQFGFRLQAKIQSEIYNQILKLSFGYISRRKAGELIESSRAAGVSIQQVLEGMNRFVISVLTAIVIVVMMFQIEYKMTLFTLSMFLVSLLFHRLVIKPILASSKKLSVFLSETNHETSQLLQGIKLIHTFSQQSLINERLHSKTDEIVRVSRNMYFLSNIIPHLNEIISVVVLASILVFSALFIGLDNRNFLSLLMTFLIISYRLSTRIQNAVSVIGGLGPYFGHITTIHNILNDADKEFVPVGGRDLKEKIQTISICDLFFRYPHGKKDALRKINLQFVKGQSVGIVGHSGSGKSSLVDLLLRLYEPIQGSIQVNGTDIRAFSLQSWRKKFGVVAQDPFLFDDSIENNIRFGCLSASNGEVKKAAQMAGIDTFINSLPLGYQSFVGERGLRLSGGERQRISLARALLRDPEVLILDEATSNLDSQSEFYIQSAIENFKNNKTAIIIAHRISAVVQSDVIIVINDGEIAERGTHKELLAQQGVYANLWKLQTESKSQSRLPVFPERGKQ